MPLWTLGLAALSGVALFVTKKHFAEAKQIGNARAEAEVLTSRDAVGVHSAIGKRDYQEDRHVIDFPPPLPPNATAVERARALGLVVGVFDGHGGSRASHFAAGTLATGFRKVAGMMVNTVVMSHWEDVMARMMREAEVEYDSVTRQKRNVYEGSTVLLAAVRRFDIVAHEAQLGKHSRIGGSAGPTAWIRQQVKADEFQLQSSMRQQFDVVVANVGDSRCVLCRRAPTPAVPDLELSRDHKPEMPQERLRIEQLGGQVLRRRGGDVYRVYDGVGRGGLAMSRAFGDAFYCDAVPPFPEVIIQPLSVKDDLALVLATDGVWDTLDKTAICDVVRQTHRPAERDKDALATRAARRVVDEALTRGSSDNCTAVVVLLGAKGPNDK